MIGRVIGWVLIAGALAVLAWDLKASVDSHALHFVATGELWYRLDHGSLNLAQAVVQRYIHPFLWDPVLLSLLLAPAWVVLAVPGALLVLFTGAEIEPEDQPRRRRRKRGPSSFG